MREEIEERFFGFRDLFAALFFFVFGLSIDVGALGSVGWLVALAVVLSVVGKLGAGLRPGLSAASRAAERERRRRARRARRVHDHHRPDRSRQRRARRSRSADLVAFSGLYVLATATIGVMLMKESKRIGRRLFPPPSCEVSDAVELRETRLPGVGVKYTPRPGGGGRVAVILHNDGEREVYCFRRAETTSRPPSSISRTPRRASSARCSAAPTSGRRSSRSSRWRSAT